jgi:hypothetical protein
MFTLRVLRGREKKIDFQREPHSQVIDFVDANFANFVIFRFFLITRASVVRFVYVRRRSLTLSVSRRSTVNVRGSMTTPYCSRAFSGDSVPAMTSSTTASMDRS